MDQSHATVRVVVADDEPMVRATFVAYLEHSEGITVIGEAADGGQAIHLCLATHPDVVLMDVLMPVADGIEATRELLAGYESSSVLRPKVVMLARDDGDEYAYEAVRSGASGVLPKDVGPDELAHAVRTVAADAALLWPGDLLRLVGEYTTPDPYRVELVTMRRSLDDAELRLVAAVAAGFTDERIGAHFGVDATVVGAKLAEVRERLGLSCRTEVVLFAVESGIASTLGAPGGVRSWSPT